MRIRPQPEPLAVVMRRNAAPIALAAGSFVGLVLTVSVVAVPLFKGLAATFLIVDMLTGGAG